ncbi:MAG TPA: transcriptional activator NhaR [Desulfurivibrionaceae bacterium]|nr:transcriptional activator NhaR [Desulfurivibrionaceae bacterium]
MEWLNYHHLYYFWTVMREGSVTAAAGRLRLAQSTISAQLAQLEAALGGKLFQKKGRTLQPTDLGLTVFRYAESIFSLGRELMDTVHGRPVRGPVRLVVGVVDALPKLVVRKLLAPAMQLSEKTRLICHEGKGEQLLAELAIHGLDIVLTNTPVRSGLSIKAYNHLLGECGVTFFGVPSLAKRLRSGFPGSLHGAPILLPTPMSALRGSVDQWLDAHRISPLIVGEFDDMALLKAFGQAGDGIFAMPSVIEEEVRSQFGVEVIGRTEEVRERFYAISVERIIKHPAVVAISKAAETALFTSRPRPRSRR